MRSQLDISVLKRGASDVTRQVVDEISPNIDAIVQEFVKKYERGLNEVIGSIDGGEYVRQVETELAAARKELESTLKGIETAVANATDALRKLRKQEAPKPEALKKASDALDQAATELDGAVNAIRTKVSSLGESGGKAVATAAKAALTSLLG